MTLTSHASPSQEASYFHRSWTGGPPTHPETFLYWEYRHRVPEKTRLKALAAQQHVLDVLAQEQAAERRRRQHEQALRQEPNPGPSPSPSPSPSPNPNPHPNQALRQKRRKSIAARHIAQHEHHLQMGGRPASQHRLYDTLTRPPPPPPSPPPPPAAEAEEELSGETARVYPLTSQETLAYLQRQRTELIASRSSAGLSRSRSSPQHALVSGLTPGQHPTSTSAPLPLPPGGRPPPLSLPCSPPSSPATVFNSPAIVFNSPAIGTRGPPPCSPSAGAQQQWQHGNP